MRYHFGDGNRGKRDGDRKKEKESEIKKMGGGQELYNRAEVKECNREEQKVWAGGEGEGA